MRIFLPWRNEFGTLVAYYCRWVNSFDGDKIVCIKPGHEALFPSVKSFFYNWEDLPDDKKRGLKTFRDDKHKQMMDNLSEKLNANYPDAEILNPICPRRVPVNKEWDFIPKPINIQNIPKCDVVLAPRFRKYASGRNYQLWPEVVNGLKAAGYSVGALGVKEFSYDVDADVKSWDYDGILDADIEMMQNAKLVLSLDSGIANLAVLCGAPVKIIYDKHGELPGCKRRIGWMMDIHNGYAKAHCEPLVGGWSSADKVISTSIEYLENN